jgi:hypothetical protein
MVDPKRHAANLASDVCDCAVCLSAQVIHQARPKASFQFLAVSFS